MVAETDDDTQSDSSCSSCTSTGGSSGSSCSDADEEVEEEGYASSSVDIPGAASSAEEEEEITKQTKSDSTLLPPLQHVWAKCRGYPWYPALIIDPAMPPGYTHNGVPIPAPPDDVLALKSTCKEPVHLVLFFDTKRTWQWLPRNKLEPLGEDKKLDQAKLTESRKPADRKAVRKAYKDAIMHSVEVTGRKLPGNAQAAIALLEEEAS